MSYRIGVDIGGTTIKVGIVDDDFNIIKRKAVKTPGTFEESMKVLADAVYEVVEEMGLSINDFPCVGVGTPGSVIPQTGKLVFSNNTNWKDVPMAEELGKHISIPLYFGNDANCAIIGECIGGAAKGKKNVIMITLGTGVGGGIIVDGKLFTGGDGLGAELGHTPIISGGVLCTCGIKGCLEAYASATALIAQTKEAIAEHPESAMTAWAKEHGEVNGQTAFDCAKAGDEIANQVVDKYVSYIVAGLGGFVNVFRPEVIIVGGGISNAGDFLMDKIREELPKLTFAFDIIGTSTIVRAELGNDAGIIGASYLDQM